MRNILYEGYLGPRLSKDAQLRRIRRVMEKELTQIQREILIAYYFQELTVMQIAEERGIHRSTVYRTLHRAENKLRRYLKY